MKYADIQLLFDESVAKYLKKKAWTVVDQYKLPKDYADDLTQELVIHLWLKEREWDRNQKGRNGWMRMVTDQKIASLIKEWTAQKRDYRMSCSLDDSEISSTHKQSLTNDHMDRMFGRHHLVDDSQSLRLDMNRFIGQLPSKYARCAVALQHFSSRDAARLQGVSDATVKRYKKAIRERMAASILTEYLPKK